MTRLFIRFQVPFWMAGILIPIYYLAFIGHIKGIVMLVARDKKLFYFFIFLLIQLLSISFSVTSQYYSLDRFFAILHNVMAYSGLFFGYYILHQTSLRRLMKKGSLGLFLFLILLVLASTAYSFWSHEKLEYSGVLGFLSGNKFFNVQYNQLDWYFVSNFPRSTVFGIYPNSTAIVLLLVHSVFVILNFENLSLNKGLMTHSALLFGVFMTGSRLYLVFSVVLLAIFLINSKEKLFLIALFLPIVVYLSNSALKNLMELREGSNATRSNIYSRSLEIMIRNNPIFGLGIKPRIPEETGFPYPVGSHSTVIGYFVKTGFLGGIYIMIGYIYVSIKYLKLILGYFRGGGFVHKQFYKWTAFMLLLLASVTEDFDAFEMIPFYFGAMLMLLFEEEKTESLLDETANRQVEMSVEKD